jgi:hypothetical protein
VSAAVNGAARIALSLIASVIERADEIRKTSSESNATRDQSSGAQESIPKSLSARVEDLTVGDDSMNPRHWDSHPENMERPKRR